jgi:hypothetical protein
MKILLILGMIISFVFGWVGEITALKGEANVIRQNQTIPAKIGLKLEKEDNIKTFKNTKMQVIFKDNTVITIGKNSLVKISDYLFDNENSTAKFKLSHGIMKTLTGKIGKFAPKRFKIRTKNASIGIRGTYFVVESYEDVIKVGMISGVTEFKNLDNMKTYLVKKGEQLVFNLNEPNNVIIKKGFIEPESVKLSKKSNDTTQTTSTKIEKLADDIEEKEKEDNQAIIKENSTTFTKFIEGLKDLF